MRISRDGTYYIHAKRPVHVSPRSKDDYVRQTPAEMSTARLRNKLCALGPKKCAGCLLCEFGKAYIERTVNTTTTKGRKP